MREYPNHIALKLLQMHRETAMEAEAELSAVDLDELRERLVRKLQRLKRRDEEQEAARAGLRRDAPREERPEDGDGGAATPNL
jgi:hypothetical protein